MNLSTYFSPSAHTPSRSTNRGPSGPKVVSGAKKKGPAVRRTVRKRGSAEDEGVKSVREDIAAFDAIDGQHVEAGGRKVVAVIDEISIGAQGGISLPQTNAVLGLNSAISTLGLSNSNGFHVAVVEQGGGVRFPAVVEVERLTGLVKRANVVLDVGDVNDDVSDMERRRKGHDESRGRFDT